MVNVYVLNRDFEIQGIIDSYVSLIWRPAYNDIGDFELYLGATKEAVNLLKQNRYLVRDIDITTDENGVITYKKVMIIKNLILTTDVENGDYLTVTGKELKYILHQRIIWGQTTINNDTAEYAIRRLIGSNAQAAVEPARVIPNMQFDEPVGLPDPINIQISNTQLDEAVIEIAKTYNYGWDIYITNNMLTVRIYKGVDRSYNQTENPFVVFSDEFDNLYNTEYQINTETYANMTLVGGEGEGNNRTYAYVNNDIAGLDRYEIFTDARDLSTNSDSEEETIDSDTYIAMLEERGRSNMAEMAITEGFTGEVLSALAFKYGVDFDLGDTVTVINKYGISKNATVLSAIETVDENGNTLIPQFNI